MKKKLLSLVLAGAMVASTSVSAFAADTVTTGDIKIEEGQDSKDVEIGITGNILDKKGNTKPGSISVTVPTAVTFTVANDGTLTSPEMTITNNSTEKISVVAKAFKDANGADDIEIVNKSEFDSGKDQVERKKIWLKLTGGTQYVAFTSEGTGKMYDNDYTNDLSQVSQDYELCKISENGSKALKLDGEGGTSGTAETEAVRDKFTLILKIKRDRNV